MDKKVIYDVGMHKGEDTDYYLKKGFKVIAFEANPDLVKSCQEKFANQISLGDLIIIEGAIIDSDLDTDVENPKIKFYRNKNLSVWGTVDSNWAKRNEKRGTVNEIVEVQKINFKKCLQEYGIPYYLKIDIEGMDVVCLKSLLSFEKKPSYISIESEKISFVALKDEFNLFNKNGYDKFKIINQADISSQKEPIKSKENIYLNFIFKSGATGLFGKDLPNKWISYPSAINRYKLIFVGYNLFGDNGKITNNFIRKSIFKIVSLFTKQSIPGWYDTHAKHNSEV